MLIPRLPGVLAGIAAPPQCGVDGVQCVFFFAVELLFFYGFSSVTTAFIFLSLFLSPFPLLIIASFLLFYSSFASLFSLLSSSLTIFISLPHLLCSFLLVFFPFLSCYLPAFPSIHPSHSCAPCPSLLHSLPPSILPSSSSAFFSHHSLPSLHSLPSHGPFLSPARHLPVL